MNVSAKGVVQAEGKGRKWKPGHQDGMNSAESKGLDKWNVLLWSS